MNGRSGEPKIRDVLASNFTMHEHELAAAIDDYKYLRERRDKFDEKIKIGVFSLNGASLLALLTLLGGSGAAASWIGLTSGRALGSAAAFTLGLILSGHSLNQTARLYGREASNAYRRSAGMSRLVAKCETLATDDGLRSYKETLDEVAKLPLVGFEWSWMSIMALNFAGGAWLFGIVLPLTSSLSPAWNAFQKAVEMRLGIS